MIERCNKAWPQPKYKILLGYAQKGGEGEFIFQVGNGIRFEFESDIFEVLRVRFLPSEFDNKFRIIEDFFFNGGEAGTNAKKEINNFVNF